MAALRVVCETRPTSTPCRVRVRVRARARARARVRVRVSVRARVRVRVSVHLQVSAVVSRRRVEQRSLALALRHQPIVRKPLCLYS